MADVGGVHLEALQAERAGERDDLSVCIGMMADWLIAKGVRSDRIIEENYATSTVGNALYSSYALARHGIKHATIISSASHVRRGQTLFEVASWQSSARKPKA